MKNDREFQIISDILNYQENIFFVVPASNINAEQGELNFLHRKGSIGKLPLNKKEFVYFVDIF